MTHLKGSPTFQAPHNQEPKTFWFGARASCKAAGPFWDVHAPICIYTVSSTFSNCVKPQGATGPASCAGGDITRHAPRST